MRQQFSMGMALRLKHNYARKNVYCNEETQKKIPLNFQGDKKGGPHRRLQGLMATVWTPFFIPLKIQQIFFLSLISAIKKNPLINCCSKEQHFTATIQQPTNSRAGGAGQTWQEEKYITTSGKCWGSFSLSVPLVSPATLRWRGKAL